MSFRTFQRCVRAGGLSLVVVVAVAVVAHAADEPARAPRSGIEFAGADVRALQADDFQNPGMLWVERGERLWAAPAGPDGRACSGCHDDARRSMRGVAARHPRFDSALGRVTNLEGRINACRTDKQGVPALAYESQDLLALTAYVANQSRGMPIGIDVEGPVRPLYEAGAKLYQRRMGQVNLACTQCHDALAGRRLLAERISQGHPNAFPIYRLEWQSAGSLHRRLRACLSGIRAEMWPYGAEEYLQLEVYLAARARGLAIETPGVRR